MELFPKMINFNTNPKKYQHWTLEIKGQIASLILNVSEEGGLLVHCKSGLAPYKYPRWYNFAEQLPKTATGKIQRYKLRSN